MATDSTSIDDLPGATDNAKANRVVLEKTEINNAQEQQPLPPSPIASTELSSEYTIAAKRLKSSNVNSLCTRTHQQITTRGMNEQVST